MAEENTNKKDGPSENTSLLVGFISEVFGSPLNIALLGLCCLLLYKIFSNRRSNTPLQQPEPRLPKMKKRDFTLGELREYDGKGPEGRILVSVNSKVFDVTRGKMFYGPGGPYGLFAGRDASRALGTFSLSESSFKDEFDDLSDLTTMQMDSVKEWEAQFTEKYDYIGRLLKPGEQHHEYTDTEDESQGDDRRSGEKKKK